MATREWGEKIWEEKMKEQGAVGVIHGSTASEEFLDKGLLVLWKY